MFQFYSVILLLVSFDKCTKLSCATEYETLKGLPSRETGSVVQAGVHALTHVGKQFSTSHVTFFFFCVWYTELPDKKTPTFACNEIKIKSNVSAFYCIL